MTICLSFDQVRIPQEILSETRSPILTCQYNHASYAKPGVSHEQDTWGPFLLTWININPGMDK